MNSAEPDGRVAIVTGGSGALGSAYCRALAGAGYRVVIAGRSGDGALAREICEAGGSAITVQADVSERESTEAMAREVLEAFGRIDVLVNNAAYFSHIQKRPFDEIEDDEWDRIFAVNVRGSWLCACAVTPAMKEQGSGRIINIASMAFRGGAVPGFAHYAASKAAIIGLTRALARELGPFGIAVNTVSPDYVAHDGELFRRQPAMAQTLAEQRCFKREQTPEDVVGAVVFLAGDDSGFITGQDIWVNGGRIFS